MSGEYYEIVEMTLRERNNILINSALKKKHLLRYNVLILYADNCPGQNKNQTMVAYLSYLVKIIKRFPCVELYFLISGHTKFSPDRNFGPIKQELGQELLKYP